MNKNYGIEYNRRSKLPSTSEKETTHSELEEATTKDDKNVENIGKKILHSAQKSDWIACESALKYVLI